MPVYPANFGAAHFQGGLFRPQGKVYKRGDQQVAFGAIAFRSQETIAARLFVGFNVGDEPRWTIENLIDLVLASRILQGANPSATLLAQKGIYQHQTGDRRVVIEDGAQVIIFRDSGTLDEFTQQMIDLGTEIARVFIQEMVIVEIQRNGGCAPSGRD